MDDTSNLQRLRGSRDPAHVDTRDPALTCITTPPGGRMVNGFHPSARIEDDAGGGGCARTSGLRYSKKRKLIRASVSSNAKRSVGGARSGNSVRCRCIPPLNCISCARLHNNHHHHHVNNHVNSSNSASSHHINNHHQRNPSVVVDAISQPPSERIAKVDPAFHPVLSHCKGELNCSFFLNFCRIMILTNRGIELKYISVISK